MHSSSDQALTDTVSNDVSTPLADDPPSTPESKPSGFDLWGIRFSYLRTQKNGWGQDEGDMTAKTIMSWSSMYQGTFHTGYRLVIGTHSIWACR